MLKKEQTKEMKKHYVKPNVDVITCGIVEAIAASGNTTREVSLDNGEKMSVGNDDDDDDDDVYDPAKPSINIWEE